MYSWESRDSLSRTNVTAPRNSNGGEGRWMGKVGRQPVVKQSEAVSHPALIELRKGKVLFYPENHWKQREYEPPQALKTVHCYLILS